MEAWRDTKELGSFLQVSNMGNVRCFDELTKVEGEDNLYYYRYRVVNLSISDGYAYVGKKKDEVFLSTSVHRLVAELFIPNPNNLPIVNHKNFVRSDNRVSNLEWVTAKENVDHAIKDGRFINREHYAHPVLNTQTGVYYDGIKEASESISETYGWLYYRLRIQSGSNNSDFVSCLHLGK